MEAAVTEFAIKLAVGESKGDLPTDAWVDKFFEQIGVQRATNGRSEEVTRLRAELEHQIPEKAGNRISQWISGARLSKLENVQMNEYVFARVAGLSNMLESAGVKEVILSDSRNNVTAIISQQAYESNPEETLSSIVRIAASDSEIEKVDAEGFSRPSMGDDRDEIVHAEKAAQRLLFTLLLAETLQQRWNGSSTPGMEPQEKENWLRRISREMGRTWLLQEEADDYGRKIQCLSRNVTLEQIAYSFDASNGVGDSDLLNVFIIGTTSSGKTTTSTILLGKNRHEDGVDAEKGTIHVTSEVDSDNRVKVWDTPGLGSGTNKDSIYTENILDSMLDVSHISAVVLQAESTSHPSDRDLSILDRLQIWFGRNVHEVLMIVLKMSPRDKNLKKTKQVWENALEELVGPIGASKYICFEVPENTDHNWNDIIQRNRREAQRAKRVIANNRRRPLVINRELAKQVLRSKGHAHQNICSIEHLLDSLNLEKTKKLKSAIETSSNVSVKYVDYSLEMEISIRVFTPRHLICRSCCFNCCRSKEGITLNAPCADSNKILRGINLEELKGKHKNWKEELITKLCDGSFKYIERLDPDVAGRHIYSMIATSEYVTTQVIEPLQGSLGRRRTLRILESIQSPAGRPTPPV